MGAIIYAGSAEIERLYWPTVVLPMGWLYFNAIDLIQIFAEVVAATSETLQNYAVLYNFRKCQNCFGHVL